MNFLLIMIKVIQNINIMHKKINFKMITKLVRVFSYLLAFAIWYDLSLIINQDYFHLSFDFKGILAVYLATFVSGSIMFKIFSWRNNKKWIPFLSQNFKSKNSAVGILISVNSSKFNKQRLKKCLRSLKQQNYQQIKQIIVVNHQKQNKQVQNTYSCIFPQGKFINFDRDFASMSQQQKQQLKSFAQKNNWLCINQTTSFANEQNFTLTALNLFSSDTEFIVISDHNSFWDQGSVQKLALTMAGHDIFRQEANINYLPNNNRWIYDSYVKECGAVLPKQQIYTKTNYFQFLQYLKNQTKNNTQKGAFSYFGITQNSQTLNGLYKRKVILQIFEQLIKNNIFITCPGNLYTLCQEVIQKNMITLYNSEACLKYQNARSFVERVDYQEYSLKNYINMHLKDIENFKQSFYTMFHSILVFYKITLCLFSLICFAQLVRGGINNILAFSIIIVLIGLIKGICGIITSYDAKFIHLCNLSIAQTILMTPLYCFTIFTYDIETSKSNVNNFKTQIICYLKLSIGGIIGLMIFVYTQTYIIDYIFMQLLLCQQMLMQSFIICMFIVLGLLIHWDTWGIFWYLPKQNCKLQYLNGSKYQKMKGKQSTEIQQTVQITDLINQAYKQSDFPSETTQIVQSLYEQKKVETQELQQEYGQEQEQEQTKQQEKEEQDRKVQQFVKNSESQ